MGGSRRGGWKVAAITQMLELHGDERGQIRPTRAKAQAANAFSQITEKRRASWLSAANLFFSHTKPEGDCSPGSKHLNVTCDYRVARITSRI